MIRGLIHIYRPGWVGGRSASVNKVCRNWYECKCTVGKPRNLISITGHDNTQTSNTGLINPHDVITNENNAMRLPTLSRLH